MQYTSTFTPDEDGDWELGLCIAGSGNLFVDGKPTIHFSADAAPGSSFFGLGTVEEHAVLKGLKAGEPHSIQLPVSNAIFIARAAPFTCRGGLRLGGMKYLDEEGAIQDAVKLAKESDGEFVALLLGSETN